MYSILVVDDELSIRESFSLILGGKYKLLLAASGEAALKAVADQKIDLVYLDIRMPGLDGLETLKRMKEIAPDLEIVMVTAVNDVQKASQAVKLEARDYIVKPFDVEQVSNLTEQILRKKALLSEESRIQKKAGKGMAELVGKHEKIAKLSKNIVKIKKDQRVLICGEAGTEKELVARLIHEKGERSDFPFSAIHLSPEMSPLELKFILFGREKGVSTIDLTAKSGILERTKNGTLFINNLENLNQEIFKPLSSLEFSRAGAVSPPIPIEAHLMGGTALDLAEKNKEMFDFFSEVVLEVPPLRERSSDIPLLIDSFVEKYSLRYGKDIKIVAPAIEALTSYSWPGNTDELEGLVERLALSCSDHQIQLEDLPLDILLKTAEGAGGNFMANFEKEYIRSVLNQCGKNKKKAAASLGINPLLLEAKI